MKRPMVLAGVVAVFLSVALINAGSSLALALLIVSAVLLGCSVIFKRFNNLFIVFLISVVVLLHFLYVLGSVQGKISKINSETPVYVSGKIISSYFDNGSAVYTLKTNGDNEALPKNIKISVYSKFAVFGVGDTVKCDMYIKEILSRYRAINFSKGIYASANVSKVLHVEEGNNLYSVLATFRTRVTNCLNRYLSPDTAATVNALTVGDKYYIENEFDEYVKRCGVSHIMVVSGLHLSIIFGSILKALTALKISKRLAATVTAVGVFMFMALCGFSMSILRAGITFFIMLASLVFIRRTDALNSLAIAVCIIICINPFALGSVAFNLSVASTAGIIILSKPLSNLAKRWWLLSVKGISLAVDAISVTLSALIFTLPLSVYYFGAFSSVAVLTNLLVGFAVTVALISAMIALPIAFAFSYSALANGVFLITEGATRYFNSVIEYFGSKPYSLIEVNETIFISVYLAIAAIFVIIIYRKKFIREVKKVWQWLRSKCLKLA